MLPHAGAALHHRRPHVHLYCERSGWREEVQANFTHLHSSGRPFVQLDINCIRGWACFSVIKSLLLLVSSSLLCWRGVMTKPLFVSWGAAGFPMYELRKWKHFKLLSCLLAPICSFFSLFSLLCAHITHRRVPGYINTDIGLQNDRDINIVGTKRENTRVHTYA